MITKGFEINSNNLQYKFSSRYGCSVSGSIWEKVIHMDGADPEVLHDDDAQHLKALLLPLKEAQ